MSEFLDQVGVYRIFHAPSGRYYIGSSKRITVRFKQHRDALERGDHHCRFMQSVWSKSSPELFVFEVLANCRSHGDAVDLEQDLLNEAYANGVCMNGSRVARIPLLDPAVMARARATANASAHYIESHRQVCLKRNSSPEFQAKATAALRSSTKHKAAVRENAKGLKRPEVRARNRAAIVASGKQLAAAHIQMARLNSDPEMVRKNLLAISRAVVGTHIETGAVLHFPSQSAAARFLGCASSNISMACAVATKQCKGYRWKNVA